METDQVPQSSAQLVPAADNKSSIKVMALNDSKAGMERLDLHKINNIIEESSKGSKFYEHKKRRQEQLNQQIEAMKAQLALLSEESIHKAEKKVDLMVSQLEAKRELSRIIVHLDMDAFYASVEMRDNPSLRDVPMAVGSSCMLSTSNYHARRFGVRAGMPGFIAKKLCPELVIVSLNFDKYIRASKEVEEVLKEYDEDNLSMSMDEAVLDITDFLGVRNSLLSDGSQMTPEEMVHEMRNKIYQKTQLTASAGIAANGLLAKICSDVNKPNNQFYLENKVSAIEEFIKVLPIRKVCGIGNVTEQMLNGLGIHTCGDLWNKRGFLNLLFKPATAFFLLTVSKGMGSSFFSKESSSSDRKSISCERTFGTANRDELKRMCQSLAQEIEKDLRRKGALAKTIALKIKTVHFEVKTRAKSITDYTSSAPVIFENIWSIYCSYEKEIPGLQLRLIGLRVSNLRFTNDDVSEEDGLKLHSKQKTIAEMFSKTEKNNASKDYVCPICEHVCCSMRELDTHIDDCLLTPESEATSAHTVMNKATNLPGECLTINNASTVSTGESSKDLVENFDNTLCCPVCNKKLKNQPDEDAEAKMNSHIDECLNMATVKELVNEEANRTHSVKRPLENIGTSFVSSNSNKKTKKYQSTPINMYFKPS